MADNAHEHTGSAPTDDDPTGGHDPGALEDAKRKMHIAPKKSTPDPDPTGGHNPEALEDAAKKMGSDS